MAKEIGPKEKALRALREQRLEQQRKDAPAPKKAPKKQR